MAASPCPHCGAPAGHVWVEGQCLNVPAHDHRRATIGFLCQPCLDRINDRLEQILLLYATLPFVTAIGSVPDDIAPHRHVKGDSAPAPVRLSVVALLDPRNHATGHYLTDIPDVAGVLLGWAECLCEHVGIKGASLNETLVTSVALLRSFAAQAAAAPWIDDYQAEIDWIWGKLRDAHGLTPPQLRPVGRCPSQDGRGQLCGGDLWPDKAGTMSVACGRCQRVFGPTYLRHLGGMIQTGETG